MEEIGKQTEITLGDMVPAEELRALTATPEDLFNSQKLGLLTSLMQSMVALAQQNGVFAYDARMSADYNTNVLDEVQSELVELGYNVNYSPAKFNMAGVEKDCILLAIDWEKA